MEFDLELAKKGYPVHTKCGYPVRIICFDTIGNFPLTALIKYEENNIEEPHLYTEYGKYLNSAPHNYDLEMVPIEKEYFVNVYKTFADILFAGNIFTSEYLAKESLKNNSEKFIRTISFKI